MAKWGIWGAHRYVWAGAAAPRSIGPDGRPLSKPWRPRSERAQREAVSIRAARPQPRWPRILGWGCIGIALFAAIQPVALERQHVQLSASLLPVHESYGPAIAIPSLVFEAQGSVFGFDQGPTRGPFSLVILAEDYRELGRFGGIVHSPYRAPLELSGLLRRGICYHAYLLCEHFGRQVKSPLITFEWR
jgi:hypothetical protein